MYKLFLRSILLLLFSFSVWANMRAPKRPLNGESYALVPIKKSQMVVEREDLRFTYDDSHYQIEATYFIISKQQSTFQFQFILPKSASQKYHHHDLRRFTEEHS